MTKPQVIDFGDFAGKAGPPISVVVGAHTFTFRPTIHMSNSPDASASLGELLDWLGAMLIDSTADDLAAAAREVAASIGAASDQQIIVKITNDLVDMIRTQVAEIAERPTQPSSGSSPSTKRAATKSRSGSSRAPAGA